MSNYFIEDNARILDRRFLKKLAYFSEVFTFKQIYTWLF